jgi:hypothetical protein
VVNAIVPASFYNIPYILNLNFMQKRFSIKRGKMLLLAIGLQGSCMAGAFAQLLRHHHYR